MVDDTIGKVDEVCSEGESPGSGDGYVAERSVLPVEHSFERFTHAAFWGPGPLLQALSSCFLISIHSFQREFPKIGCYEGYYINPFKAQLFTLRAKGT